MSGALILDVFLVAAVVAIAIMVFLGNYRMHDALPQQLVSSRGYALRRYWFWLVLIVAVATFAITIPHFPYPPAEASANVKHFTVIAQQYAFQTPAVVPLNEPILFDVTSRDVNHGFGIYGPSGALVSQVQAMPGYVNHLPERFRVRGHYVIRCLEYCGIAHADMRGGFDVR